MILPSEHFFYSSPATKHCIPSAPGLFDLKSGPHIPEKAGLSILIDEHFLFSFPTGLEAEALLD